MATAKLGPLVGRLAGTVGGATFINARGAVVVQRPGRGPCGRSAAQLLHSATLARLRVCWQSMSTDYRRAWQMAAEQHPVTNALGLTRTLSPWAYFVGCTEWQATVRTVSAYLPQKEAMGFWVQTCSFVAEQGGYYNPTITWTGTLPTWGAFDFKARWLRSVTATGGRAAWRRCAVVIYGDSPYDITPNWLNPSVLGTWPYGFNLPELRAGQVVQLACRVVGVGVLPGPWVLAAPTVVTLA